MGRSRGPDPLVDHEKFCEHVKSNLKQSAFNDQICSVLLNQKYFNGIGNYLRAEILYAANISPFMMHQDVLADAEESYRLLHFCYQLPCEVLSQELNKYGTPAEVNRFTDWCKCYGKMKSAKDKKKRTIWYCDKVRPALSTKELVKWSLPEWMLSQSTQAVKRLPSTTTTPNLETEKRLETGKHLPHTVTFEHHLPVFSRPCPFSKEVQMRTTPAELLVVITELFKRGKIDHQTKIELKALVLESCVAKARKCETRREVAAAVLFYGLEAFKADYDKEQALDELSQTFHFVISYVMS